MKVEVGGGTGIMSCDGVLDRIHDQDQEHKDRGLGRIHRAGVAEVVLDLDLDLSLDMDLDMDLECPIQIKIEWEWREMGVTTMES